MDDVDIATDSTTRTTKRVIDNGEQFLKELQIQVPIFLNLVVNKLKDQYGIDCSSLKADHVCWRTETLEEYTALVKCLQEESSKKNFDLLIESEIGGRPIATFGLVSSSPNNAIQYGADHVIDVIEIPSPKDGSPYKSGLEHVEFVIDTPSAATATSPLNDSTHQSTLDAFMAAHSLSSSSSSIQWNTKAKTKQINPDISLKLDLEEEQFGMCSVKFHLMALRHVIEWEKKNKK